MNRPNERIPSEVVNCVIRENGMKGVVPLVQVLKWIATLSLMSMIALSSYNILVSVSPQWQRPSSLRVMTFSLWLSGFNVTNGTAKIVRQIQMINPDIIAFQDVINGDYLAEIVSGLGSNWHVSGDPLKTPDSFYRDTAVAARHPIEIEGAAIGRCSNAATVLLDNSLPIVVFSVHLTASHYGPYTACNDRHNRSLSDMQKLLISAEIGSQSSLSDSRFEMIKDIGSEQLMQRADVGGHIVAGVLNSPSHRDWTGATGTGHCGAAVSWPVTRFLEHSLGFEDALRKHRPDPLTHPENTWSPVMKSMPQDRIDYIFHKGHRLVVRKAFTFTGYEPRIEPYPEHKNNQWPSDHAAVVADFDIVY